MKVRKKKLSPKIRIEAKRSVESQRKRLKQLLAQRPLPTELQLARMLNIGVKTLRTRLREVGFKGELPKAAVALKKPSYPGRVPLPLKHLMKDPVNWDIALAIGRKVKGKKWPSIAEELKDKKWKRRLAEKHKLTMEEVEERISRIVEAIEMTKVRVAFRKLAKRIR